jgi:hypothetical protein
MESGIQVGYVPIIDPESTSSGSEGEYDGSDSDISQELLTSNVGVTYAYQGGGERLRDERRAQEHIDIRNKYFTPDIIRHNVYCKLTAGVDTVVNLKDYGFDIDRVIGFKLVKGYMIFSGDRNHGIDITIPEIPYLACKKNADHASLIEVIYVSGADEYYENKNLFRDAFFNPIKLSILNIKIAPVGITGATSYLEFEVTTLNRSVQ